MAGKGAYGLGVMGTSNEEGVVLKMTMAVTRPGTGQLVVHGGGERRGHDVVEVVVLVT